MATVTFGDDFEWDDAKAASNLKKHRVTFVEAVSAVTSPGAIAFADTVDVDRVITLGISDRSRALIVVTTEAGERTRIISARRATASERATYEEGLIP